MGAGADVSADVKDAGCGDGDREGGAVGVSLGGVVVVGVGLEVSLGMIRHGTGLGLGGTTSLSIWLGVSASEIGVSVGLTLIPSALRMISPSVELCCPAKTRRSFFIESFLLCAFCNFVYPIRCPLLL